MNRELEESLKNSYLVRRRLSTLRKLEGDACYILNVERFQVRMYTNAEFSEPPNKELPLTAYKAVTVEVWEDKGPDTSPHNVGGILHLRGEVQLWNDYRFKDFYEENKWTDKDWQWKNGSLMPLSVVCDLIKHIDRIVELTPFH